MNFHSVNCSYDLAFYHLCFPIHFDVTKNFIHHSKDVVFRTLAHFWSFKIINACMYTLQTSIIYPSIVDSPLPAPPLTLLEGAWGHNDDMLLLLRAGRTTWVIYDDKPSRRGADEGNAFSLIPDSGPLCEDCSLPVSSISINCSSISSSILIKYSVSQKGSRFLGDG